MGARGMTLEIKKNILIKILKEDYKPYWEENKKTLQYIDKIIEFRNKLAHSEIDFSDDALKRPIEDGIAFVEWDNAKPITDRDFNDWEVAVNMFSSCLNDVERLLPYKMKKS